MSPTVRDAMSRDVLTTRRTDPVAEVAELLHRHRIRHLPVLDEDDRVVGLITSRDLNGRALGPMSWLTDSEQREALSQMQAFEVMTDPVQTVSPDLSLAAAARTLIEYKIGCLPVVEGGRLVGMLTESDFVRIAAGAP